MKSRLFLLIAIIAMAACQSKDPVERQIDNLLSQMTLEEKIAQMVQINGGNISDNIAEQVRNGAGSMLNSVGAEANYYQRIAVEESRLGIPMIFARDVIHGFRTIFPIPLGQAATFNPDVVETGARIAAEEAMQAGLRWTFSPMVDVARDPRWGRVAESYGEDTYLASVMGAAAVRGYQGNDSIVRMAACVKHFAGYSASEGGRDYNSTWIPEVQLRETYLPPFKAAVDAGSMSVMCAFNDLNGVPASGNKHLNVDILRHEWLFDGVLISDWASLQNMNNQGNSATLKEATQLCINAQMDMDMESQGYPRHLKELVLEGKVSEALIDNCVRNILRMKFRLGLFDNPYCYTENPEYFTPEALSAAQKAAEESAVLLKNNGILPISNNQYPISILVCGPMANAPHEQNGTWCFDKDDAMTITPMMAFRELAKEGKVRLIEQPGEHWSRECNKENIATLARLAKQADVVLYFAGEESILSGEARCRAYLDLPGDQSEQIRAIKATGKPLVLTVMAGRPLCIREDIDRADAVLYAFHGGTMQGPALANLIMGKVAPSGRLPMTFPMSEGQIPFYYNYKMPSRVMAKSPKLINDIPVRAYQFSVGESSYWLEHGNKPEYPFGYGLTYTTFEYGPVVLSDTCLIAENNSQQAGGGSLIASCDITNTGSVTATAVPQLYIRDVVGSLTRPLRELKGFQRVEIPAGETRTVRFEIAEQDLAYWHLAEGITLGSDGAYAFSAEKGEFHVWIAPNAAEGEHATFLLE